MTRPASTPRSSQPREEPKVLLDQIVKAVRANRSLLMEFKDHRGQTWRLSMNRVPAPDTLPDLTKPQPEPWGFTG